MILEASKRLRKFFNNQLTDEMIWQEIIDSENLENIHQLRRLNVEAARALVKRERRKELLSLGIVELSPEVAAELIKYNGEKLFLNCVLTLTPDTAKALSRFRGYKLMLNGIRSVSLPVLGRLASYKGSIHLDGVETFDVEEKDTRRAQTVLGNMECARLSMNGLKQFSLPLVYAFARFPGYLELKGIKTLSRKQAEILAESSARGLAFKGIQALRFEMVNLFTRYMGFLDVSSAQTMEPDFVRLAAGRPEKFSLYSGSVKRAVDIYLKKKAKEELKKEQEKAKLSRKDDLLLAEFDKFDKMDLTAPEVTVSAWEDTEEPDPYSPEIEDSVVDDIEKNLNQEIKQKKKKVEELLSRGFSNLSKKEKELLEELRGQIEDLKNEIRGALDILVEKKELGSVIFTNSEDLAAYLKQSGAEDDEDDALANIEEADLFGGSFDSGSTEEEEVVITDSSQASAMMDMWGSGTDGLDALDALNQDHQNDETNGDEVEGDDFVFIQVND